MYPTDDYSGNTTQQTCTKPLSLSSVCLYQTDGPYFATGPHTLPTKLNIYTHHTHVLALLYPTNTIKNVYLSIKNCQCLFNGLDYIAHMLVTSTIDYCETTPVCDSPQITSEFPFQLNTNSFKALVPQVSNEKHIHTY